MKSSRTVICVILFFAAIMGCNSSSGGSATAPESFYGVILETTVESSSEIYEEVETEIVTYGLSAYLVHTNGDDDAWSSATYEYSLAGNVATVVAIETAPDEGGDPVTFSVTRTYTYTSDLAGDFEVDSPNGTLSGTFLETRSGLP